MALISWLTILLACFNYSSSLELFDGKDSVASFSPNDVRFYFFPNPLKPKFHRTIIYGNAASLKKSGMVPGSGRIHVYVHGFSLNYTNGGCLEINRGLAKRNKPLLCVDWGILSAPNFPNSVTAIPGSELLIRAYLPVVLFTMKVVSRRVADFLIFLKQQKIFSNLDDLRLLGHSVGANIVGLVANILKAEQRGGMVGRITGLDPGGLFYQATPRKWRLTKDKATYVDAIHTDAGVIGTSRTSGHVDFFPFGGRGLDQPGCGGLAQEYNACGHMLSIDYWERMLLGEVLRGCRCRFSMKAPIKKPCPKPKSCIKTVTMGEQLNSSDFGTYYLDIPANPPPAIAKNYEKWAYNTFI